MIVLILVIFGLALGSFINALVWRLKTKRNWVSERSVCPHCKHVLAAKDLIPVVSWLTLGGKCRYCKKPISAQYPAIELLTTVLFVCSYLFWPYTLMTVAGVAALVVWLLCLIILVALLVYDLKWMLLPNSLVAVLTVFAVVFTILRAASSDGVVGLVQSFVSGITFFAIFWTLFTVSKGKWIGGGDVKLALPLGLLAGGIAEVFLIIFLASLIGTLYVLPSLVRGKVKVKTKLPFGPLLIIATVVVVLFGGPVINWYLHSFLYL